MSRLLDDLCAAVRVRNYSNRTRKAYVGWVKRFVRFSGLRHPRELGKGDIERFIGYLATERDVAASTQNQALSAILFLYRHVLGIEIESDVAVVRAKRGKRIPTVLAPNEVTEILRQLDGDLRLIVMLLYGSGLRLNEALTLRIKDVDVQRRILTLRDAKGGKDRRTVLPEQTIAPMSDRLMRARQLHLTDVSRGGGYNALPHAFGLKVPSARRDWRWAWVFPATRQYRDGDTGELMRYHLYETTVSRAITQAASLAGINKRVTAHTFRHSFATQLLRAGYDIRTVQSLLGHRDVSTTMLYLHVLESGTGVRSPLDGLDTTPPAVPLTTVDVVQPPRAPSSAAGEPASDSPTPFVRPSIPSRLRRQ
ncbi:MAG: integron integrase [Gemmatimonadetes bacterium]|nr:integron integrase [Gemmatimonadota bacterium]